MYVCMYLYITSLLNWYLVVVIIEWDMCAHHVILKWYTIIFKCKLTLSVFISLGRVQPNC